MAGAGWAPPRLDEFILTEPLGSGTYATVYKAYRKVGPSPPRGSPFCSPICPPRSRGTPVFHSSIWGTAPIAAAWHRPPPCRVPSLPSPPGGRGEQPGVAVCVGGSSVAPVLGRGTRVRWWPSSASTRGA